MSLRRIALRDFVIVRQLDSKITEPDLRAKADQLLLGTPEAHRTRLADLVNTIDPKLVAAAFGMNPESAMAYLADHLDESAAELGESHSAEVLALMYRLGDRLYGDQVRADPVRRAPQVEAAPDRRAGALRDLDGIAGLDAQRVSQCLRQVRQRRLRVGRAQQRLRTARNRVGEVDRHVGHAFQRAADRSPE